MPAQILVVDDDPNIREVIAFALEKAGHGVGFAEDGAVALERFAHQTFDLVVLDIGLPERDGLEVCREIRKTSDVPILFLTARDDEIDRILGLEIGGDDYVTKPFSPRELVARIKAILKRSQGKADNGASVRPALSHGQLALDVDHHVCTFGTAQVPLTPSEFSLLSHLMIHPLMVVSRQSLITAVYGHNVHVADRTVDSHIRNIRKKLSDVGCADGIATVHGVGLRMGSCQ